MKIERELLKGAGELAVLRVLAAEPMYGYQLAKELDRRSGGVLALGHGTLYPLLYNLENKGLVESEVRPSADGPERRYYRLTEPGRDRLRTSGEQWSALVEGLARLVAPDPEPARQA